MKIYVDSLPEDCKHCLFHTYIEFFNGLKDDEQHYCNLSKKDINIEDKCRLADCPLIVFNNK